MPWTPTDAPDPFEILNSAVDDTRTGSHADALAKFLWFHHNALDHDYALSSVRLSFALGYWSELGDQYPPARSAFLRTRDEAEAAFADNYKSFELFQDLAALNRQLDDGLRTADAFCAVARKDPAAAERVYHVAQPYLVACGRFEECNRFLDPAGRLELARQSYEVMGQFEEEMPAGEDQPSKLARTFYVRDMVALVGLLVLNRRADEASRVREQALGVVDDDEFRAMLDAAMSGHLPPTDAD